MGNRLTASSSFSVATVEDGFAYDIIAKVGSVTIAAGSTSATLTSQLSFFKREGSGTREAYSCYYVVYRKNGTTYTNVLRGGKVTIYTISSLAVASTGTNKADAVVVCIYSTSVNSSTAHANGGYLAELVIPVLKNGNTGAQGKMGRNIYYAGKLSEVSGTNFKPTDYESPYVDIETGTADSPVCYVYVGASSTTNIPFPTTAAGYTGSSDWELMATQFKYIISKAIMSGFARLGSWIFNGDYMFSIEGRATVQKTIEGTTYEIGDPVSFDGTNWKFYAPGNSSNTYTPNVWMNANSGEGKYYNMRVSGSYFLDDIVYIKDWAKGEGGNIDDYTIADSATAGGRTLDFSKIGSNVVIQSHSNSTATAIRLPVITSSMVGRQLTIVNGGIERLVYGNAEVNGWVVGGTYEFSNNGIRLKPGNTYTFFAIEADPSLQAQYVNVGDYMWILMSTSYYPNVN